MSSKVQTVELVRVFKHKGKELPDPDPSASPEKAVEILALAHPELNNAVVEPPEAIDGKLVYPLKVSTGTKG